jgi:phospholipid transport system substrate-binding protein
MTRFAVGPKWSSLSASDQAALIKAFTRLTVANYAKNFDGYDGERFTIDPQVDTRGPDKLVRSHLLRPRDKTVDLTYRMRQVGDGRWKIIDVYYNGSISELAARRSDFASSIAQGPQALVQKMDDLSTKLMRG